MSNVTIRNELRTYTRRYSLDEIATILESEPVTSDECLVHAWHQVNLMDNAKRAAFAKSSIARARQYAHEAAFCLAGTRESDRALVNLELTHLDTVLADM